MNNTTCSLCGGVLIRGRAAVRKTLAARLRWPFPSDRLFYKADGEESKPETVIREGISYEAYKCRGCGGVFITREKWSAF